MAAPIIISTTPLNDENNVYINQFFYVTFSVDLLSTSVNDNTFLVYRSSDYEQITGETSYSSTEKKVTFIPDNVLDTDTSYTLIIVGADQSEDCVKSSTLESLALSESIQFVTGTQKLEIPQSTQDDVEIENSYAPPPTVPVYDPIPDPNFAIVKTYPANNTSNVGRILPSGLCAIDQIFDVPLPYLRDIQYVLSSTQPDPSGWYTLYAEFNKELWPTGNDYVDWIDIEAFPVNGDPSIPTAVPSGFIVPPSGYTLYWTSLDPSGWRQNNEIVVTIYNSVMSASGNLLSQDQQFMFTTAYSPMYCTVSKIRLAIGPYIRDFTDDTINRRIYENSILTYQLANETYGQHQWGIDSPSFAAKMYTCCKTQYDLLGAKLLDKACSAGQMKSLGDFTVQNPVDLSKAIKAPMDSALACMEFWVDQLIGKKGKVHPKMAIKGISNSATPPVRGVRTWVHDPMGIPASNTRGDRSAKLPNIYSRWS